MENRGTGGGRQCGQGVVIDVPVWDAAKWRGVAVMQLSHLTPPMLGLMFENPERQLHQFAHGCAQSGHLGFTPCQQALIQCLDMRVVAGSNDGGHIEGGADAR